MLYRPAAVLCVKLDSSLKTPFSPIEISGTVWWEVFPSCGLLPMSTVVKAVCLHLAITECELIPSSGDAPGVSVCL